MARLKQIEARTDLGYFGMGLVDCKNGYNLGGVIRALGAFGGRFLAVSGKRWQSKGDWRNMDTEGGYLRFPCYLGVPNVLDYAPEGAEVVAVEMTDDAENIASFVHPKIGMYLFGPEDGAIPDTILASCKRKLYIPTEYSLNLYTAASIVAYDRMLSLNKTPPGWSCPSCGHGHYTHIDGGMHCNACGEDWWIDHDK